MGSFDTLLIDGDYFKPKNLYYFINPNFDSLEPHFHVCIVVNGNDVYFLCCTSKFKSLKRLIIYHGHPYSTLVRLSSHKSNKNDLKKETFVDCNKCHVFTKQELLDIRRDAALRSKGEISEADFQQLSIGVNDSLLIEEYIKEMFPIIE